MNIWKLIFFSPFGISENKNYPNDQSPWGKFTAYVSDSYIWILFG